MQPWHDPTNADPRDTAPEDPGRRRALVRASTLPRLEADLGPGVAAALARSAALLREDADLLDALAAELLAAAVAPHHATDHAGGTSDPGGPPGAVDVASEGGLSLDVDALAAAHAALRTRALHQAATCAGVPAGTLAAVHVEALDRLVTAWHGQGPVHLPGAVEGRRACGRLLLASASR
ncbi:TilS substrate-binding domain-containing protein [Pseudokineococcus sp. 1T1Z-3]|uniref:TilS substrate-binding domain-containing protein n=1 Tax=Pseudokineococcus sp. 1T1Z-3 TaxID=3132745 RepID=UPI0030970E0A